MGSSLLVDKVIVGVWNDLGCWSAKRFEVLANNISKKILSFSKP